MLDRLVYVLFFIFVGSGLFLVYQGLKGMGYLGPTPTATQVQPMVQQKPVPKQQASVPAAVHASPATLEDLQAVDFVVKYLPATDHAAGCQFYLEHFNRFSFKKGETNLAALVQSVMNLFRATEQLSDTNSCLVKIAKKTLMYIDESKTFDWKSELAVDFLANTLPRLAWAGHFAFLSKYHDQILPVLKMKLPIYIGEGRLIEQSLCMGLKHMGRKKDCLLMYPVKDSPNMQVYTLGYRVFYDEEWKRLGIYVDRMQNYKEKGRWKGFEAFLRGINRLYVKNNLEDAIKKFEEAYRLADRETDPFLRVEYQLQWIRTLRNLGRLNDALERVNRFIEDEKLQADETSFGMMILLVQKLIIYHQMNKEVEGGQALQKKFTSAKPEDEYGDQLAKAFDALMTSSKSYKATLRSQEFLEVEKVLNN